MSESKRGKYLTWSEVEGYIQATLYNEQMIPVWIFTGLYQIDLENVNVKILVAVPEVVESSLGGDLVAEKNMGVLTVRPESAFRTQEYKPVRRMLKRLLENR